jgi:hypothetical protein
MGLILSFFGLRRPGILPAGRAEEPGQEAAEGREDAAELPKGIDPGHGVLQALSVPRKAALRGPNDPS